MDTKEIWVTATFLTLYTGFIFAGFGWMLTAKIEPIQAEIKPINAEIALVKSEIALVKENQVRMETEQKDIKERMIRIESMLSQILVTQNIHHKGKARPAGKVAKNRNAKVANRKTASN